MNTDKDRPEHTRSRHSNLRARRARRRLRANNTETNAKIMIIVVQPSDGGPSIALSYSLVTSRVDVIFTLFPKPWQ